jgi:general secretion pathway protein D
MMADHALQITSPRPQRAISPLTALFPVFVLLCGLVPAQVDPPVPPTPRMIVDEDTDTIAFSMNETNGMELTHFVKWAQEVTGKRFTYNIQELTGGSSAGSTVSFLGTFRIKRERFQEDFYSFFQTMLYIKGYAVVPRGDGDLELLEIVMMTGTRGREVTNGARYVSPDELINYRFQTGVPILTTWPLKHINAQLANNALRPFFATTGGAQAGGSVQIGNVGNKSALLLQGFGPQVYAAVQLLKLVDEPAEEPNLVVQVVPLEHQAPEEIEPILTEVLESRSAIRQQVLQEQNSGSAGSSSARPQLKVVVHSSQKSLVLSGTQPQVIEALDLIARLDVPGEPIDASANVIRLKNVLAEDLEATLKQFMQEDNSAETAANSASGTAGAAAARRIRKTVINSHKESNSLLISAAGTKWKQVRALVESLDQRQPQVLIEACVVELTTGDLDRFGIELGLLDLPSDTTGMNNYSRGFGFTSFGQSVFEDTDDDSLPDTRLPDFDNPLQGITGGIISGDGFAVPLLINALSTDDKANILSLPSVLVNNNETAVVRTTEARPTQTQNQGTATTSSGSGPDREAGITLSISPTISPNNYLRLNISLDVSRFVGAFDPNSVTGGGTMLTRYIQTQVTMPSDATMVIGGIIEDSESESNGGIPFLKDIPILGILFRRSENTSNKTNLYFFVTPTILDEDSFQDLYHVSLNKKLEAEQYIGTRRLRIIDRRWSGMPSGQARTLEDMGSTIEDLDAQGEFEMPTYRRHRRTAGPASPDLVPDFPNVAPVRAPIGVPK